MTHEGNVTIPTIFYDFTMMLKQDDLGHMFECICVLKISLEVMNDIEKIA